MSGGSAPTGVSVAIVSWNGREHLETCLPALEAQRDPGVPWEVLVLDNGSRDGTAAWLRREWVGRRGLEVRLLESPVNLGFCSGNNRLVEEASHDAVALLNNDTRPDPSWLAALVDALASAPEDVAAVSGRIVDWEGERLDFARGVMTFDGHAFQQDFRRPLGEVEIPEAGEELLFACGGNLLVRRRSFLEAGGFDPAYFAYLEDVDLGWRLWAGGERVVFAPDALVHHRSSATSDLLGLYHRGFLFERNAFLTAYKNYQDGLWQRMMPAVMLTLLSRAQCLLVHANPGGQTLTLDPYAGNIADTGGPEAIPDPGPEGTTPGPGEVAGRSETGRLWREWLRAGTAEMLRRGVRRLGRRLAAVGAEPGGNGEPPSLTDERTVAQLRVHNWVLAHLEEAAERRRQVQARRRRDDREIFERFPLHLVPTYPGDEDLFEDEGFRAWLPEDEVPFVRRRLEQVMCFE